MKTFVVILAMLAATLVAQDKQTQTSKPPQIPAQSTSGQVSQTKAPPTAQNSQTVVKPINEDENKITLAQWGTWIGQVVTIFVVFLSWRYIPLFTERRRKEAETEIWQHKSMSDSHRNLIVVLHELEQQIEVLMLKYKCNVKLGKISDEELNNLNNFVTKINTELAMMYTLMPEEKYEVLKDKFTIGKTTLTDQKENLLVAMRPSQFPTTKFSKREDIIFIRKFKKPPEN